MLEPPDSSPSAAEALVAETGAGRFAALVAYAGGSPFDVVHGPRDASLDDALTWARTRAAHVVVRVDDQRYSAGREPVADLPPLAAGEPAGSAAAATDAAEPVLWQVRAGTVWHGTDLPSVAAQLGAALRRDRRTLDEGTSAAGNDLAATFTVLAATRLEAGEIAAHVLRRAWLEVGIAAVAGVHFDASYLEAERV